MGMQAIDALTVNDVGFTTNPAPAATSSSSSSSSGTRRSGVIFDPASLAAAMNSGVQLTQNGGSLDVAIKGIADAAVQRKVAEQEQLVSIQDYANKAGEATRQSTEVDAINAAQRSNILTISNIDPNSVDSVYHAAMGRIHQTSAELETLGAEIDSRAAVGMFDNPLEWLINQVRLPGMVGQYNSVVESQNRKLEEVRTLQSLANTQISLSTNMDADAIRKAGEAKAATEASAAQAKLAEVQKDAANATARDIATMQALNRDKFTINLNLAQLTKENFATGEYASEKEAALAAEQFRLDKINEYQRRIGSSLLYDMAGLRAMPKSKVEAMFERAGTPFISTDLAEAVRIISTEGSMNKIAEDGDSAAVNWLRGSLRAADAGVAQEQARILTTGGKALPEVQVRDSILSSKKQQYLMETNDMRKASEHNPYRLAYPFLAKQKGIAEFQNNIVAKYVNEFGPESKTPAWSQLDEAVLMDKIVADVSGGLISSGEAAQQVATFYKMANTLQALRSKYPVFDIPENKNYVVKLPGVSNIFSILGRDAATVDLTNQAAVETYLIKNSAAKMIGSEKSGVFGIPPRFPDQLGN